MNKTEELLKHYGVLGMKWGVRKDRKGRGPVKQRIDSLKRERDWGKSLKEINTMKTKDVQKLTRRIELENQLKSLSRSEIGDKKAKNDYLQRDGMSTQELSRKVSRLNAKKQLHSKVSEASKEQRQVGERIANTAKNLAMTYAVNQVNKKKTTSNEVLKIIKNPKKSSKKSLQSEILDQMIKQTEKK